ncbi:methyl-accepting chemotaxis protein [Pararhizobium gei]|uniref:methyl-accepting chemotaxis protein n=1 Tax=Pararhizobium gei TaxID=1395951 RepID=UPI0023DB5DD0|nr:methyl-accepting chemotaxis protein [Rhizobium gei]
MSIYPRSINSKLAAVVCVGIFAAIIPIGSYIWLDSRSATLEMTNQIMVGEAQNAQKYVNSIMAEYAGAANATAALMAERQAKSQTDRVSLMNELRAKLVAFPDGFNSWYLEEPGALDGRQKEIIDRTDLGTNKEGLFATSYSRGADGAITGGTFEKLVDSEWYRLPVDSGKGSVTNPFVYPIGDKRTLIATVVYPIKVDGKLVGITGNGVDLARLSTTLADVHPMGTGRVTLLSAKGEWVVNPDSSLLATPYGAGEGSAELSQAVARNEAQIVPQMSWQDGTVVQRIFLPFKVSRFDTTWVAVVDVPVSTINGPLQRQSIAMMIGLGVLILLVAGIAWLVSRIVGRPIRDLAQTMAVLAKGDLSQPVKGTERTDEIGAMAKAVEVFKVNGLRAIELEREAQFARTSTETERAQVADAERMRAEQMLKATRGLADGLQHLSDGNLTFELKEPFAADFESLRTNFNTAVTQLRTTLKSVTHATTQIDVGSRELSQSAFDLSKRTEQQAASLEETAAALDEITTNVSISSKRAEEARAIAQQSTESAKHSGEVVATAVDAMQRIEHSSSQISNIIGVINEIAFQTNLLALNAGVEAARAGDAGKGFAVVAQEVRELAQRSAQAAKEIKTLIRASAEEVGNGVRLVSATGEALKVIEHHVVSINTQLDAIATSAREQAIGLAEVNTAVNHMDQTTQQNAAMVEQSTAASETLASEAENLRSLVARFKLGGGAKLAVVGGNKEARSKPFSFASPANG